MNFAPGVVIALSNGHKRRFIGRYKAHVKAEEQVVYEALEPRRPALEGDEDFLPQEFKDQANGFFHVCAARTWENWARKGWIEMDGGRPTAGGSPREIAVRILQGEDITDAELLTLAEHVAGKTHLKWKGGVACNRAKLPEAVTTNVLSDVTCGLCRGSRVFEMALAVLDGGVVA